MSQQIKGIGWHRQVEEISIKNFGRGKDNSSDYSRRWKSIRKRKKQLKRCLSSYKPCYFSDISNISRLSRFLLLSSYGKQLASFSNFFITHVEIYSDIQLYHLDKVANNCCFPTMFECMFLYRCNVYLKCIDLEMCVYL